jgi:hypothetical protein
LVDQVSSGPVGLVSSEPVDQASSGPVGPASPGPVDPVSAGSVGAATGVSAAIGAGAELPGLAAVCELLARAAAPSPLSGTVPVVGRLAEGCLAEPGPWRDAAHAWRQLRHLAESVAADVDALHRSAGGAWQHPGIESVAGRVQRAGTELAGVGEVASAMAGTADQLHALLFDAHVRFVAATVAAAARAQLAGGYADATEQAVHTSAILGEWLADVMGTVAGALTRCAALTRARGPVGAPLGRLLSLAERD